MDSNSKKKINFDLQLKVGNYLLVCKHVCYLFGLFV